ncbi:unnamed protein product [Heterobilharzia americana]|nr:unnamed protein product [Heterobilharzia americana]
MHTQPTCFQTDPEQPDLNGYHWLIIDFGIVMHHVKEVRLAPNPSHKNYATKLSNIDVFLIKNGESLETDEMLTSLRRSRQGSVRQINWNSTGIHFCHSTGTISAGTRAASIECPEAMHGRWLALRRLDGELNICLINVYVKKAFEECFIYYSLKEQQIWPSLTGQPFSFIRHLSKSACRAGCSSNRNCQAIRYRKARRTGVCEQIRDVVLSEDLTNNTIDGSDQFQQDSLLRCDSEDCSIALNKCQLGKLYEMHRVVAPQGSDVSESDGSYNDNQSGNKFSVWEVKSDQQTAVSSILSPIESGQLLSIQMDGYLYCSEAICDTLKVYSVDENKEASFCGEIDSLVVSHLSKYYLFCENNYPIDKLKSIRLEWNNRGRENTGYLLVNITQMFIRITQNAKLFSLNLKHNNNQATTHPTTTITSEIDFITEQQWSAPQHSDQLDEQKEERKDENEALQQTQHIQQEAELLQQYYQQETEEQLVQHHDQYSVEGEHQKKELTETSAADNDVVGTTSHLSWFDPNTESSIDEEDDFETSNSDFDDEKNEKPITHEKGFKIIQKTSPVIEAEKEFVEKSQNNDRINEHITTTGAYETLEHIEKIDLVDTNSQASQPSAYSFPDKKEETDAEESLTPTKLGVREARRDQDGDRPQVVDKNYRNLERKSPLTAVAFKENKTRNIGSSSHNPKIILIATTHFIYILTFL